MSDYRLVLTRIDPNPAYNAKEVAAARPGWWYPGHEIPLPGSPTIEIQILAILLTEEEWTRVKRAVLDGAK